MIFKDKFARFTERMRKVLTLSNDEARRMRHSFVGTEHLLLGLVGEGHGIAAKVLQNLGVGDFDQVRDAVQSIIGVGEKEVTGEIGMTNRAKKVIELAADEARRLNHHYVGTEHLLLGLIREGQGIAAKVLAKLNIDLEQARTQVVQVLTQLNAEKSEPETTTE